MEYDCTSESSFALNKQDNEPVVAYFYDPDIGSYHYGTGHPMKPQRIRMTHSLILAYKLYREMDVYKPHYATKLELIKFHHTDYVNFLSTVMVDNYKNLTSKLVKYNLGENTDCPVFEGLIDFQSSCAGASIDAAIQLNHKKCDIAINWSGGLHHARKAEASGFCYINDVVLAILELLKYHTRVMYIDIDVHHGDGVEEAFYLCHRVLTVSFHRFGGFFPGTGDIADVGGGPAKYYAVNVPLNGGITDELYLPLFKDIIGECFRIYRPEAVVIQCGADSVTGDKLGNFNLTTKGHSSCIDFVKSFGLPLLMIGGGGYTIKNVARAWLTETAVALGKQFDISNTIPDNEYYSYYAPNYELHLQPDPTLQNKNTVEYCKKIKEQVFENLKKLEPAPSVDFMEVPTDFFERSKKESQVFDSICIDWEGEGIISYKDLEIPRFIRRRDYKNDLDETEDRDQKSLREFINA